MSCKIYVGAGTNLTPGGCVTGTIICDIHSDKGIREIRCVLKGKEKVSFKQGKSTLTGNREFLLQKLVLRGEGTIPQGHYEFPFSFTLPMNLPTTFEATHCSIQYSLKATVDIPFDFDYEEKISLIIEYPIDLNRQAGLLLGNITYEWEESSTCFCCDAGLANLKVTLEGKNAYLPGEIVKMFVDLRNLTSNNVEALRVTLAKVTTCKSDGGTENTEKDILGTVTQTGVGAHGDRSYNLEFCIPSSISKIYSFDSCELISQVFRLRVEGVFPMCYENIVCDINLILGHIPLMNSASEGF